MMATHNKPKVYQFKEVNKGKHKTVRHYEYLGTEKIDSLLSEKVNISDDRNFAKSKPDYWLKIRLSKKWSESITGLFKTEKLNIYRGDINNRSHLLMFKFSEDKDVLTIYLFKHFYTSNFNQIIKQHLV